MKLYLIVLAFLFNISAYATGGKTATLEYIEKYRDVAIKEMKEYGIPASITLAQGILESGSGLSYLATEANNHFGIKCHLDWDGKRVYKDDDKKNECFRAYKNPDESFRDHSLFLKNRSRYAFLFEESPTDYKAWAKGLKKAGYATNRKYPQLLIDIIERHELHKYDLDGFNVKTPKEKKRNDFGEVTLERTQINVSTNRVKYVEVQAGDTFESLAEATDNRVKDLLKYNELHYDAALEPGQRLYLQPKRKKAGREFKTYKVQKGDDMYSISQKFGIRLKYLYKRNDMTVGAQPEEGTILELR